MGRRADIEAMAAELLRCALAHEPEARLLGNVTAEQVAAVARFAWLSALPPSLPAAVLADAIQEPRPGTGRLIQATPIRKKGGKR